MTGNTNTIALDHFSTVSTKLDLFCNGHSIGAATGFVWKAAESYFLVSNWHVFSGRRTDTGQPARNSGAIPDTIKVRLFLATANGRLKQSQLSFEHLNAEGSVQWLQHPRHRQDVDIAALKLPTVEGASHYVHISRQVAENDVLVTVGTDVFVVGYPMGISNLLTLPIWKRGSIASELDIPFHGKPSFIIDSATREGMSGSPVYAVYSGGFPSGDGTWTLRGGRTSKFMGVYSGRLGTEDELAAQLGIVWHASLVDEVVLDGVEGSYALYSPTPPSPPTGSTPDLA